MTETAVIAPSTKTNKMTLREFFEKENIYEYSRLDVGEVEIIDQRRWERLLSGFDVKTVITFLIPYYVKTNVKSNISRYAFAEDYHYYFKSLSERLEKEFRGHFRAACDTSPINEVSAAVKSGLGNMGLNGLIINKRYGTYAFVAEFFSDLPLESPVFEGVSKKEKGQKCRECGACEKACVTGGIKDKARCVSFINQKKKLDAGDCEIIKSSGLAWGCDVCQEVCPENSDPEETEIEYFREKLTPLVTGKTIQELIETDTFSRRAYAWRGLAVTRRNIEILGNENE